MRSAIAWSAWSNSACVTASAPTTKTLADDEAEDAGEHPLAGITDFDGNAIAQEDLPLFQPGTALVVDFWASWCGPCRQSFRYLDQLYRTFVGRGLSMVAVSVDDDPLAARRFFSQFRPRFSLAWDPNADVRERFGVVTLPTTLLLDGDGQIVTRNVGFDVGDHRALEERVRAVLDAL